MTPTLTVNDFDFLKHGLSNVFGSLKPGCIRRLRALLKEPTQATWKNAYSIILRADGGGSLTVWKAWRAIDSTVPMVGPELGKPWGRIPTQDEVLRLLAYAALRP
jgi:hypothetical protein